MELLLRFFRSKKPIEINTKDSDNTIEKPIEINTKDSDNPIEKPIEINTKGSDNPIEKPIEINTKDSDINDSINDSNINDSNINDSNINDSNINDSNINYSINDSNINYSINDSNINYSINDSGNPIEKPIEINTKDSDINDSNINYSINDSNINDSNINYSINDSNINDSILNDSNINDSILNDSNINDSNINYSIKDININIQFIPKDKLITYLEDEEFIDKHNLIEPSSWSGFNLELQCALNELDSHTYINLRNFVQPYWEHNLHCVKQLKDHFEQHYNIINNAYKSLTSPTVFKSVDSYKRKQKIEHAKSNKRILQEGKRRVYETIYQKEEDREIRSLQVLERGEPLLKKRRIA